MKCYVFNCNKTAVEFIELTAKPYNRLPICRKHEQEFPPEYPRVDKDKFGNPLK